MGRLAPCLATHSASVERCGSASGANLTVNSALLRFHFVFISVPFRQNGASLAPVRYAVDRPDESRMPEARIRAKLRVEALDTIGKGIMVRKPPRCAYNARAGLATQGGGKVR